MGAMLPHRHQAVRNALSSVDGEIRLPVLSELSDQDRQRLHDLAAEFLLVKTIEPVHGACLDPDDPGIIALLASLPILNLGLRWYRHWRTVLVYPDDFVARRQVADSDGLIHEYHEVLSGEAWEQGPVVLSLRAINQSGWGTGYNVVVHEMAHTLDMINGRVNGCPPLHDSMDPLDWSRQFGNAFKTASEECRHHHEDSLLNEAVLISPGEFFAVVCEQFFERPRTLRSKYPEIFNQLVMFFRHRPKGDG